MSTANLIADLAKKSGLVWVSYGGATHAIWHEWVDDAVCVVIGGTEQKLPGITDHDTVTLLLRSKSTRALAAEAPARVEIVAPDSEQWDVITSALKSGRLNLHDSPHAVDRWARESVVLRLVPLGAATVSGDISSDIGHTAPHLTR